MERQLAQPGQPAGALSVDAAAGLRSVSGFDGRPWLLAYYPKFTTNPYQSLLYGAARAHGLAPVPVHHAERVAELIGLQRAGLPTVLHLHWLHLVLRDAASASEARRLVDAFLRLLDDHRSAGGHTVWTVHNILPHSSHFEDDEIRLSAEVAARSDVIHVMAERTAELVAPMYALPPDRLLTVPHMSYLGAYEDAVSGLDARHELGLDPDDFVFATVGAIRPYKGLDTLLDAWATLEPDGTRRLVIAGAPSDEPGIEALVERAALDPTVVIDARKIPAAEMQLFLRAADCAVLPHLRALNSGALALALTFGLPVILPDGGGLEEMADARFARTVRPGDPAALADALRAAPAWVDGKARSAALQRATELAPPVIAERFATGLRARLDALDGTPA